VLAAHCAPRAAPFARAARVRQLAHPRLLFSTLPPVCLDTIEKAACGQCLHHFCYECLMATTRTARMQGSEPACPVCRQPLKFINKDPQFDKMVAVITASMEQASDVPFSDKEAHAQAETVVVDFREGQRSAGVCMQAVRGPGVRVSKVLKSGRFYDAGARAAPLRLTARRMLAFCWCQLCGVSLTVACRRAT
jgi:hypothetical protein